MNKKPTGLKKHHESTESESHLMAKILLPLLVNDSSAKTAYIYWGSLWRQTCCSVIDGKLQLKPPPASKKVT